MNVNSCEICGFYVVFISWLLFPLPLPLIVWAGDISLLFKLFKFCYVLKHSEGRNSFVSLIFVWLTRSVMQRCDPQRRQLSRPFCLWRREFHFYPLLLVFKVSSFSFWACFCVLYFTIYFACRNLYRFLPQDIPLNVAQFYFTEGYCPGWSYLQVWSFAESTLSVIDWLAVRYRLICISCLECVILQTTKLNLKRKTMLNRQQELTNWTLPCIKLHWLGAYNLHSKPTFL